MELQSGISAELNELKVGRTMRVLVDRKEGDAYVGRTEFDSPEVDNEVIISAGENPKESYLRIGDFVDVEITSAEQYDLYGNVV